MTSIIQLDLQETTGTSFADSSGNGNDGSGQGSLDAANDSVAGPGGKFPLAISFDGVNDWIDLPDAIIGSTGSISVWSRLDGAASTSRMMLFGTSTVNRRYISHLSGGVDARVGLGAYFGMTSLDASRPWVHTVLAWDGTTGDTSFYVDGQLQGSDSTTLSAATGVNLGSFNDGSSLFFHGAAAGLKGFDHVLTATEIAELLNEAKPQFTAGPTIVGVPEVGEQQNVSVEVSDGTLAFEWLDGGIPIAGATSDSFTPTEVMDLSVRVTSTNSIGSSVADSAEMSITEGGMVTFVPHEAIRVRAIRRSLSIH